MGRLNVWVCGRGGRGHELARADGEPFAIGRAWGNDLVLADPYVAPRQLLLEPVAGGWTVRVLERTNEVLRNGEPLTADSAPVASGDRLTVGRTDLLLFDDEHPVEPARRLLLAPGAGSRRPGPVAAFAVLAAVSVFDLVTEYYTASVDLEWWRYGYAVLFAAAILLLWSGLWAIAGRVLRHQPHFSAQLVATALVSLGLTLVWPLPGFLEFLTGSVAASRLAYFAVVIAALVVLLRANLLLATNVRHVTAAALLVATTVVGLVYAGQRYAEDEFRSEPEFSTVVWPPLAQVWPARPIDEFIARARQATD